jgi:hypothetical protein
MNKFPIRVYSKKELALCYFPESTPHTAVNRLMAWILQNNSLITQLQNIGYQKSSKLFSPRQVELITEYLGTPNGYE